MHLWRPERCERAHPNYEPTGCPHTPRSEGQGQPLVEIFGVRFPSGEAPTGTVSAFDGKRGQIIYSLDEPSSIAVKQRPGGWLPLSGPYRAISADGCVAIVLDLRQHRRHDTAPSSPTTPYVDEILLDVYAEATRYDEAITHSVSSACGDGRVEVAYALLSDAAEAVVEVKLLRPRASGTITGTVFARTDVGKVVLFHDDGAEEEEETGIVPLARSVVAVPLTSPLTVEVDLVVDRGCHGSEVVVKESVVCVPKIPGEDLHHRSILEVKITWLD